MDKETLVEHIRSVLKEIEHEKGNFTLAMLVWPEIFNLKMVTLVLSSTWLDEMRPIEAVEIIIKKIHSSSYKDELSVITRVSVIHSSDPLIQAINSSFQVTKGSVVELNNRNINGVPIDNATIMVSGSLSSL